jgi:hypothetical protein
VKGFNRREPGCPGPDVPRQASPVRAGVRDDRRALPPARAARAQDEIRLRPSTSCRPTPARMNPSSLVAPGHPVVTRARPGRGPRRPSACGPRPGRVPTTAGPEEATDGPC